jgi:hypothetical protein
MTIEGHPVRVGGVELGAVRGGEGHVGQDVGLRPRREAGEWAAWAAADRPAALLPTPVQTAPSPRPHPD